MFVAFESIFAHKVRVSVFKLDHRVDETEQTPLVHQSKLELRSTCRNHWAGRGIGVAELAIHPFGLCRSDRVGVGPRSPATRAGRQHVFIVRLLAGVGAPARSGGAKGPALGLGRGQHGGTECNGVFVVGVAEALATVVGAIKILDHGECQQAVEHFRVGGPCHGSVG